jgi:hypothetical protein
MVDMAKYDAAQKEVACGRMARAEKKNDVVEGTHSGL